MYRLGNAWGYGAVLAMAVIFLSGCQGFALLDQPPEASFTVSDSPRVGEPVVLDASASLDPQGYELTYEWEFRAPTQSLSTLDSKTAKRVTFYPDSEAPYQVSLKVTARLQAGYSSSVLIVPSPQSPNTVLVTLQAGEGGRVVPSGARALRPGDLLYIEAVASPGYAFQNWSISSGAATILDLAQPRTELSISTLDTRVVATFVSTEKTPEFLVGLPFPGGLARLGESRELEPLSNDPLLVTLVRDANGILYGLGDPLTPRGAQLYTLDPGYGTAIASKGIPFVWEGFEITMSGAAFSPSGRLYVVEESGAHRLFVANLFSGQVTVVGTPYPELDTIAFSPDGVLYGLDSTWLYRIDPNSGSATYVAEVPVQLTSMTFSSQGVLYAVEQGKSATIYSIDRDNGDLRKVITVPGSLLSIISSP